ncbi:MAG: type VI secretion system baseplate subunit TssG [Rhodocyclales bacterium GT-UBC]|nr:MAG: type VI secretion system baseplate subunit TssG [Rhodocyclales bacterium GT-UBC]
MASPRRRSHRHLNDELQTTGPRFQFFQAVRLLALSNQAGSKTKPLPDNLRFASPLSLSFPASEIAELAPLSPTRDTAPSMESPPSEKVLPDDAALRMTVGFMGLTGPSGALPVAYTEMLIDRRNQFRDTTAHQFLDIFTHRAISLFYQAWHKHRFYLPYEAGDNDGFSRNLLDLVGLGLGQLQQRLAASGAGIPDRFLIHYAGLLARKPVSASNIVALIEGYFGISVRLEQFIGQWLALPPSEQTRLGSPCLLGQNTFLGERVWDRQNKIRLVLGPLDRSDFEQFMPGGTGRRALFELVQFCVGLTLDCEVQLILKHPDIPEPQIDRAPSLRLGCNIWLNAQTKARDADDSRFMLLSTNELHLR